MSFKTVEEEELEHLHGLIDLRSLYARGVEIVVDSLPDRLNIELQRRFRKLHVPRHSCIYIDGDNNNSNTVSCKLHDIVYLDYTT